MLNPYTSGRIRLCAAVERRYTTKEPLTTTLQPSVFLQGIQHISILNLRRLRKALSALPIPEQSVIPTVSLKWQKVMADGVLVAAVDAKAEAHRRPFLSPFFGCFQFTGENP